MISAAWVVVATILSVVFACARYRDQRKRDSQYQ